MIADDKVRYDFGKFELEGGYVEHKIDKVESNEGYIEYDCGV
jgi:hypothetical protein